MGRAIRSLLALVGVVVLACDEGPEPRFGRRGYILDDTMHIRVPASFRAHVPDTVVVTTFGNGCVSLGYTEIAIDDLQATVEPYDWDARLDPDFANPDRGLRVCNDVALEFVHTAELVFRRAGNATIFVVGVAAPDSVITAQRSVLVR